MSGATGMAQVAALLGDPARANMMIALMDGGALTAKELAFAAHISPQTASGHLGRLSEAGLIAMARQGRHHYHRIASPMVGRMVESIMAVAEAPSGSRARVWRGGEALRNARTCYDHLAGRLGVAVADSLQTHDHIRLDDDGGALTPSGEALLVRLGVATRRRPGRVFCRPCLDWSERRPHIAGAIGAALTARCFDLGWIERIRDTRAVMITPAGRAGFAETFAVQLEG